MADSIEELFEKELIQRGYPIESIARDYSLMDNRNERFQVDILVHIGNVCLQAFEIKKWIPDAVSCNHQIRHIRGGLSRYGYSTPVFLIMIDRDHLEIYDEYHKRVKNIDDILNFEKARDRVYQKVKEKAEEHNWYLWLICITCPLVLMGYIALYCYNRYSISGEIPFTALTISSFAFAVLMLIVPYIIKLSPNLLKLQMGMFSVEAEFQKDLQQNKK